MANPIQEPFYLGGPIAISGPIPDRLKNQTRYSNNTYQFYPSDVKSYTASNPRMRENIRIPAALQALGLKYSDLYDYSSNPFSGNIIPMPANAFKKVTVNASNNDKDNTLTNSVKNKVNQDLGNPIKQSMPITNTAKSEEYVKKMYAKQNELNHQLGTFNSPQDTQEQGDQDLPQNLLPVNLDYGTDSNSGTKNPLGDSTKKKVNQNVKKDTSSVNNKENNTGIDTIKPEQPQTLNSQDDWATKQAYISNAIQNYYNDHGVDKSLHKLTPAQQDYYNYLTGYQRMAPNLAIARMGLDPNKHYY